ncbi:hypothetical protein KZX37_10340 [Microbacterium sp. EYE_5]|uniref:DUF6264 family protein n=1 Tax=unclassified Microbacterium TaxID=2609290 RepID=UPI0020051C41|nr:MULTISPECIES: DUF6264 family protein [unclassified Microbacterium]MCK6081086.1 hypothetical protein [Microbacterium sp. EYE_382]MCK6086356.1 hypothetical protein [Microbacterium sp. EYE_384]MCK6124146.1 hypothetical protein [Microbacterium sp. EYE_80]MCK6127055.1 hypothetical protein [Microbacterium sp. EYE_79]MCK6142041.1 hypothetical protein [Microbacterium sp. EYE_39]
MNDPRPQPQYGEYATPEQQRAAIRQPSPEPAPTASVEHPHPPTAPATTVAARPTRLADRIITVALLAYGLVTVVGAIPQLIDFSAFAEDWMRVAGIDGTFTNTAQGRLWGGIGAAVFAGGWLLTAALSWWSLSRRRLTWWIPLVGAIVTFLIASFCLVVPLVGDPGVAAHFGAGG